MRHCIYLATISSCKASRHTSQAKLLQQPKKAVLYHTALLLHKLSSDCKCWLEHYAAAVLLRVPATCVCIQRAHLILSTHSEPILKTTEQACSLILAVTSIVHGLEVSIHAVTPVHLICMDWSAPIRLCLPAHKHCIGFIGCAGQELGWGWYCGVCHESRLLTPR